ncbi:hypothetical protein ATANTOWER_025406 [Ataeniobius toweri]|uniref:Uncharacterized protein n=1 Tax=Ataeniobius toweri TaxID=208326 RepID=A0ABU7B8H2_9TELE|nr:hypothetical protein [Ataeniobius toweri]
MEGKLADSDVGAEAPGWVDLETQLKNMQALVLQTRGKEEGDKVKKKIEKQVREAMKEDGLNLTDKWNLGDWFRKQMNIAKKNTQAAQGKLTEATVWSKGKYRTDKEKCEKEERFWGDMVLIHQGGNTQ